MKTTICAKPSTITKNWFLIDATDLVLGRLASQIAKILRGKHKTCFTPHMDCGDYVIVINAEKIKLTGKKFHNKVYHHHTGFVGGIKSIPASKLLENHPEQLLFKAVQRMISRNKLGRAQMTNLRIYSGNNHPHAAQNPKVLDVASLNSKNKRSI